jgi:HSP20 family protein
MFNISPATDVAETDKQVKVSVELPGMDAKDVTVAISEGYITIKGKKSEEKKEEKNGYFHQERSYGEFQRVISLPANISSEKAEASISKGLLTVTVPKKEGAKTQTRKVEVKQAA